MSEGKTKLGGTNKKGPGLKLKGDVGGKAGAWGGKGLKGKGLGRKV